MNNHKQQGFGAIAAVAVLAVFILVGFAGWFVWHANLPKPSTETVNTAITAPEASTATDSDVVGNKTYINKQLGFAFDYPAGWTLKADLHPGTSAYNNYYPEGEITVTSPNQTVVTFAPNQGGKGGDCADDQNNRTTKTCPTRIIYSADKLASSTASGPIYLYTMSQTKSTNQGGSIEYYVDIMNGDYAPTKPISEVAAFISHYDQISLPPIGENASSYLSIKTTGKDDAKNNTAAFFETQQAKEITTILKTFRLL